MDSRGYERARIDDPAPPPPDPDALEFVRFCHRRRRVGWPDLYDEMCGVAARGLFRGYGPDDLSRIGIGFALFEMPALASLVTQVLDEEQERRKITGRAIGVMAAETTALDEEGEQGPGIATEVALAIGA